MPIASAPPHTASRLRAPRLALILLLALAGPLQAAPFTPASDEEVVERLPARPGLAERRARAELQRDPSRLPLPLPFSCGASSSSASQLFPLLLWSPTSSDARGVSVLLRFPQTQPLLPALLSSCGALFSLVFPQPLQLQFPTSSDDHGVSASLQSRRLLLLPSSSLQFFRS